MMDSFNNYICHFCQQSCKRRKTKMSKNRYWHICKTCNVGHLVSLQGVLFITDLELKVDPNRYHVSIDYDSNQSNIEYWTPENWVSDRTGKKYTRYIVQKLLTLDFCIKDLTPLNIKDKIKTYLLFS